MRVLEQTESDLQMRSMELTEKAAKLEEVQKELDYKTKSACCNIF